MHRHVAEEAIRIASKHAEECDKRALMCLYAAESFMKKDMYDQAFGWAVESLRCSIGVLHPEFPEQ